ncbi:MAG: hypothetical protein JAZ19_18405 [Candidatus Thiodiazotropha taylori]|nr:hypothetical protein [Candidatus Thiodiazotropha taylori]RLW65226.1 MAG: hypothetical protein B6D73_07880 [gamma proteobacterium symbiont of Stewartia floridana]MCG7908741.1 hypothetical protein [Candidatus Thiodiazotropha taylori]MCG7944477.1 hypothetical protein [Candidatus Thiodiazotropha taylori]MCG7997230.1 hypothetical protein [Candidatus Thiodiazotropha taylori]
MKTVYDMSSGQIIETGLTTLSAPQDASQWDQPALELALQPVTSESPTKCAFPPELVLADLNAFIEKMS